MATFTYIADNGASLEEAPRVLESKFGDGYQQRVGDGINIRPRKWSLTFNSRTDAELAPIVAFLRARNGIEAFDWTDPEGVAGKFVCKSWTPTKVRYGVNNLTAEFNEVFEP